MEPPARRLFLVRMSIAGSRLLEEGVDPAIHAERRGRRDSRIDWRTGFFLATAGGADVLDIPVGRFAPGNKLDAILVDAHWRVADHRIMEAPDVEAGAKLGLRRLAKTEELELANLVGAGLARPGAIAFDFPARIVRGRAGGLDQIGDGAIAAPALAVQACVDHQATGAEQRAVRRPALYFGGKVSA